MAAGWPVWNCTTAIINTCSGGRQNPCLTEWERIARNDRTSGFTHRRQLIIKPILPLVSEKTKTVMQLRNSKSHHSVGQWLTAFAILVADSC